MWDFINVRTVKAAKPHRCEECKAEIATGDLHSYRAGKVEGFFEDYRLCLRCAALAAAYCREFDADEGFPLGDLRNSIREQAGVEDLDAWLAESEAKERARQERAAARKARVEALGEAVICDRCNATLATYGDACSADLDDACPGFRAIERAQAEPAPQGSQ